LQSNDHLVIEARELGVEGVGGATTGAGAEEETAAVAEEDGAAVEAEGPTADGAAEEARLRLAAYSV
jgi:hypothetical protein